LPILGHLPVDPRVQKADREGVAVYDAVPELATAATKIAGALSDPS
jgi:hypothetical protein